MSSWYLVGISEASNVKRSSEGQFQSCLSCSTEFSLRNHCFIFLCLLLPLGFSSLVVHYHHLESESESLSHFWLFETPWTVAHQAPLSMEFSKQEYCSGLPFPSPGDLPDPGIEPRSPALQENFFLFLPFFLSFSFFFFLLSEPLRKPL